MLDALNFIATIFTFLWDSLVFGIQAFTGFITNIAVFPAYLTVLLPILPAPILVSVVFVIAFGMIKLIQMILSALSL